jgi:NNP family nitrate/nitrite transporter-like MFS transporter
LTETAQRRRPEWSPEAVGTATTPETGARRSVNVALATWVSAINVWAWNMIGPLSTTYAG